MKWMALAESPQREPAPAQSAVDLDGFERSLLGAEAAGEEGALPRVAGPFDGADVDPVADDRAHFTEVRPGLGLRRRHGHRGWRPRAGRGTA